MKAHILMAQQYHVLSSPVSQSLSYYVIFKKQAEARCTPESPALRQRGSHGVGWSQRPHSKHQAREKQRLSHSLCKVQNVRSNVQKNKFLLGTGYMLIL